MNLDEILKSERGARFYRGDLHIHSIVGSHDVVDKTATPEAIVQLANREGIDLIAIADHNEISAVSDAVSIGEKLGVFVVPAVELSTAHGHLLCYLPTVDALTRFHSRLTLADRGKSDSRCSTGIIECLDLMKAEGGFAVLAHIDGGKGLEVEVPGNPPHKKDIICHPALLGIELTSVTSDVSYSDNDSNPARKSLGRARIDALKLGKHQFLARVLNSDAHSLKRLGRNASDQKKVTRYKMKSLSFSALRLALEDADARVRIEDEIPAAIPMVRAIKMEGGFLSDQYIHFGPNLNCIIGGRGTGKSLTFEAIRMLTGQNTTSDVVDSDVWPERIELVAEDRAGQFHTLERTRGGEVFNQSNPFEGPISIPVECYGQGETQAISQKAHSDPAALLEYLDRFIEIDDDLQREVDIIAEVLDIQSEIEKATQNVERIPQVTRDLALKKSQLDALEKANAREIIALVRKLESEKQVRNGIRGDLKTLTDTASLGEIKEIIEGIKTAADPSTLQVGQADYVEIVNGASALLDAVNVTEGSLKSAVKQLNDTATLKLDSWLKKSQSTLSEIEEKKKELAAKNIKLDMVYINRLTQEEASLKETLRKLKMWEPHLKSLRRQRAQKMKERWAARARIAVTRSAFAQRASATLKSVLGDLQVSLKFEESAHSPDAEKIITEAMGWRTSQVPRATILMEQLTLPALLEAVDKEDISPIQALRTREGAHVFNKEDAEAVISKLAEPAHRFRLERSKVVDRPVLTVTRPVSGQSKPRIRDFSRLSLGQQQSVLLALMLSVDTERPLIIDQPEDNLDSEFIYRTLVPVLRRAKERRQVIIVTHNANIAVLGDAEQIIVLKSNADRSLVVSRGSIDHPETRDYACNILEGSDEAFRRRAHIYGVV